jgi:hypothetical protein
MFAIYEANVVCWRPRTPLTAFDARIFLLLSQKKSYQFILLWKYNISYITKYFYNLKF